MGTEIVGERYSLRCYEAKLTEKKNKYIQGSEIFLNVTHLLYNEMHLVTTFMSCHLLLIWHQSQFLSGKKNR